LVLLASRYPRTSDMEQSADLPESAILTRYATIETVSIFLGENYYLP
jgi:hypothetical protein